ncbi:hypothetical protein Lal_00011593 [Lupinus albus]|nr:hypothetical protein Lal_00011593 [Lupinus albus]
MGKKKPTARGHDDIPPAPSQGGGGKSKKKVVIDDDEYAIAPELAEEPKVQEEKPVGKKKGKKGNAKVAKDDDDDDYVIVGDDNDDVPEVVFSGKKKGKSKKDSGAGGSLFALLGEEEGGDDDGGSGEKSEEDEPVVSFTGKKKSSKGSKKSGGSLFSPSAFDAIDDDNDGEADDGRDENDDVDEPVIAFTGKKKSSKGSKKGGSLFSAAGLVENDDEQDAKNEKEEDDEDDEDIGPIIFSGKKKSSKSSKKAVNSLEDIVSVPEADNIGDEKDEEDVSLVAFSGKKKSSKKKSSSATTKVSDEIGSVSESVDVVEPEQPSLGISNKSEVVAETSKSKKKKNKKSGRTAQEEDDLDKILAELGEAPPVAKPVSPPPLDDKVQPPPEVGSAADPSGEKEGDEETVETAAAKKKKKKKEKEKEKKAAAAAAAVAGSAPEEVQTETIESKKKDLKTKVADKKVPKHVREMQEALARRQEAEERKRREEEERLRKEEEERIRKEEEERQAEEARRRKKEREKEKLLKKKQEGKLLTGKQKEEARRLEAMRKQFLNSTGSVTLPAGESATTSKRPIYKTKKSKPNHHHQNGSAAAVETAESAEAKGNQEAATNLGSEKPEKVEVESMLVEDKVELSEPIVEDAAEDEDDEWDAKSWDDLNLNAKGAFADEEPDSEPEPVVKKELKSAGATKKTVSKPVAEEIEDRKPANVVVVEKSKKHDLDSRREPPNSAVPPKAGEENLRSPICCIMGHVDTGKTKLLDCIRGTNVQEGEAGGITQQIGATFFPAENIRERTKELKADAKLKVPGLLVIDTPGHESFTNLRSRGSGLCDIAILVVDIMHGLEPQTIESLNLLKMRNTEFIIALNKVDRLYGWKTCRNSPIVKAMKQQTKDVQNEFNMRLTQIITQFKEQGLNTELYYKNKEMGETFSIVPTSAISGEGIPDMLLLLVNWTQKTMVEKLTYSDEVQCTVLEVKVVEGHGTTIDVVLVNGVLHEGDQIVSPIVTTIRALLTPHPMKELRVKGTYVHHKEIKAAMGIKITAQGLENAIAGTALYVVKPGDDVEDFIEAAEEDMNSVMSRIDRSGEGVCVQASTLGSLEALLEFLKTPEVNIPVSGISIGPVHKKDVMKASVMLEKKREYATILAFDVKVTPEARELADDLGVKVFIADIIYHLFDQFKAYIDNIKEEKKREAADEAVFPCVLRTLPNCVFNKKDPIVLGVDILEGILKIGTPICIPSREFIDIGRIASIENNHKPVDFAKKGQKVAIKIVGSNSEEQQKMFGRHFEIDDELVSHISRSSIDVLKANYRDDLSTEEWRLVVKLKAVFKIQ